MQLTVMDGRLCYLLQRRDITGSLRLYYKQVIYLEVNAKIPSGETALILAGI